ncbi:MAG: FxsA family protein [Bacillota bacterium]
MFIRLLLLFTLVPMIELALLIQVGGVIGIIPTLILVAATGVIGVSLAKMQGFLVVNKLRSNLNQGKLPADEIIQGVMILVGGAMLLTPGLLTDVAGFLFILPGSRPFIANLLKKYLQKYIEKSEGSSSFNFYYSNSNTKQKQDEPDIINGDYEYEPREEEEDDRSH